MKARSFVVATGLAAGLFALGCGSSPGAQTVREAGLTPDARSTCDPAAAATDAGSCLLSVSGRVVDESGAGLSPRLVSVCAESCFFGRTGADGTFTALIDAVVPIAQYATLLHGRPDRASYYLALPPVIAGEASYPTPLLLPLLPATGPVLALDGSA